MFLQLFSHVGFDSIWENLISASDDCAHAPGKPKRFSLAAHVHATMAPAPTHWNRRSSVVVLSRDDRRCRPCPASAQSHSARDGHSRRAVKRHKPIIYKTSSARPE